jgi:hypothetical protein
MSQIRMYRSAHRAGSRRVGQVCGRMYTSRPAASLSLYLQKEEGNEANHSRPKTKCHTVSLPECLSIGYASTTLQYNHRRWQNPK